MRSIHTFPTLTLVLFLSGCASAAAPPRPTEPEACREPSYLQLKGEHPDSLSDRAWERLQQLEQACRAEQSQPMETPAPADRGHHLGAWLWMPAMMLLGGMMWLMMGAI